MYHNGTLGYLFSEPDHSRCLIRYEGSLGRRACTCSAVKISYERSEMDFNKKGEHHD